MRPKIMGRRNTLKSLVKKRYWEKKRALEKLNDPDEDYVDSDHDTNIKDSHKSDVELEDTSNIPSTQKEPFLFNDGVEAAYRVVDFPFVLDWIQEVTEIHLRSCESKLKAYKEEKKGLFSSFTLACSDCSFQVRKDTEKKKISTKKAVLGTIASGGTHAALKHLLGIMDIPCPTFSTFSDNEKKIVKIAKDCLVVSMAKAAAEEKDIAIAKNQIDKNGIPWIRVGVDACWSKRAFGHSYVAASGVGVIIGRNTGKVLFIGVKNKFCTVCSRAANLEKVPPKHVCYKNWTASSGGMEAAVIVEGFNEALDSYGLKYLEFIGDGDSNVCAKIRSECSYGTEVTKLECKNHIIKNYGKYLFRMKSDTKSVNIEARRLLTTYRIKELQNIAIKCITNNMHGDIEQLKQDLSNGPYHVFGKHDKCRANYCVKKKCTELSWPMFEASGLLNHIKSYLNRIVRIAHRLIDNETNNRSEAFMAVMSKFNAGKRLHLTGRGCFEGRAFMAALSFNEGQNWPGIILQMISPDTVGETYRKYVKELESASLQLKERRSHGSRKKYLTRKVPQIRNETETAPEYGPSVLESNLIPDKYEATKIKRITKKRVRDKNVVV